MQKVDNGARSMNFWTSAQKMTLNRTYYAQIRDTIRERLAGDAKRCLAVIELA